MQAALLAFLAVVEFQLANGLRVVLHEDHQSPEVLVHLDYGVGSRDEALGQSGVAHLFEHLMFMGTKRYPNGQFDAIMEQEGGSNNASTTEDRTSYFSRGPKHLVETFLRLEADRMATLAEGLSAKKLALQREVVKNERRQSYEDEPYGVVELMLPSLLFAPTHAYGHPVIGTMADLDRASVASLRAFFARHYAPENCVLVVDGDFDSRALRGTIERLFGGIGQPGTPPRLRTPLVVAPLAANANASFVDRVALEEIDLVWHAPSWLDADGSAAEVLAAIIGGNKASRLYRALAETRGLASSVEAEIEDRDGTGLLRIKARALDGKSASALEVAIRVELDALRKSPPDAAEVARAVAFVETRTLRVLDDRGQRAAALASLALVEGSASRAEALVLGQLRRVDVAQVARVIERVLSKPHARLVVTPKAIP